MNAGIEFHKNGVAIDEKWIFLRVDEWCNDVVELIEKERICSYDSENWKLLWNSFDDQPYIYSNKHITEGKILLTIMKWRPLELS